MTMTSPSDGDGGPPPPDPDGDGDSGDDSDASDASAEGVIVPISDTSTLHRLVSGQAISDLASAAKELIDNALDASATAITIRLYDSGLDAIEVSDDGGGIPRGSRPLVAMEHATSKLRKLDDLYQDTRGGGQLLGFRGEALFSLANLSENLVVTTREEGEECGERWEYRSDGYARPSPSSSSNSSSNPSSNPPNNAPTAVARRVGTTVRIHKLFHSVPVRRVDMERRIKAQKARLMKVVQGYAVLCLGVRFRLVEMGAGAAGANTSSTYVSGNGGKAESVRLQTSERSTRFEDTVSAVLGTKFLGGLCRCRVDLTGAVVRAARQAQAQQSTRGDDHPNPHPNDPTTLLPGVFRVEGLVSKAPAATAAPGQHLARDLQFFSINGRPVDLPKISRAMGDAWRSYDGGGGGGRGVGKGAGGTASSSARKKQRPACILSLFLPNHMYDVNLSPDKRDVLLNEESMICDLIRDSLAELWAGQTDGTFVRNEVEDRSNAASAKAGGGGGRKRKVGDTGTDEASASAAASDTAASSAAAASARSSAGSSSSVTPPPPPPTSSSSPPSPSPRQRMRRRNAFVNNPERVGGCAPDVEFATGGEGSTDQATDEDATTTEGRTAADTDAGAPASSETVRARTPSALRPSSESSTLASAADRQSWEQTRLRFNKAGAASQKDDIAQLAAMEASNDDGLPSDGSMREKPPSDAMDEIVAQAATKASSSVSRKRRAKRANKRKRAAAAAADDLQAFAFGASKETSKSSECSSSSSDSSEEEEEVEEDNEVDTTRDAVAGAVGMHSPSKVAFRDGMDDRVAGDGSDNDNERDFTKAIGQVHSPEQFKRHRTAMRRNSIFRTLDASSPAQKAAEMVTAELGSFVDDSSPSPMIPRPSDKAPLSPMQVIQSATRNTSSGGTSVSTGGWAAAAAAVSRRGGDLSPSTGTSDQPNHQAPTKRRRPRVVQESPSGSDSTSRSSDVSPPEPVTWGHFGGTSAVVSVARATRLQMESMRRDVKAFKKSRKEGEGEGDDSTSGGYSGPDEIGIAISDEQGAAKKRAKGVKGKRNEAQIKLHHNDFGSMEIIGQFNCGFILCRCRNNNLWILDQHACDEKFNFERLCANTTIHEQRLIAPLPLELSPSEESCVLDHMDIFEKNGFRFEYDETKPPRHRLSLTALPHSGSGGDGHRAVQFGKEDVGAMCAILGADGASSSLGFVAGSGTGADGSGLYGNNAVRRHGMTSTSAIDGPSIVRLPKAIAMFASRACRSSIMIGTTLSQKEMEVIVRKMKNVNAPWDCAHGRPTLRHVTELIGHIISDERSAIQHTAGPNLAACSQVEDADDADEDV